jgi:4-aminobutyrate--pyruvate transaminase
MIVAEGPETIAAFIAEPITGASGVIVPPAGYYQKVQVVLNRYDIMFWADEVITGFGRTGSDFGCNTMGIESPDMMTFAKQLSSAYMPISASAIRRDMYDAMIDQTANAGAFGHGYTYSGHPVACAVALKVLEIYQRDQIFEKAAKTGAYLQQRLASFADHPLVGEVRGSGLLGALELVANKETGEAFVGGAVGGYAQKMAQDNGLLIRAVAGSSLGICPPLIITEQQIDEMVGKLSKALDATLEHCTKQGLLT